MPYHLLASEGGGNEDFATEDVYVNVQPSVSPRIRITV